MRNFSFKKTSFKRVGGLIDGSLDRMGLKKKVLEQQAINKWREAVGVQIASASRADNIRDGVLFVCCKTSVWSNELTLHKPDILKKINKAVGAEVIKDIRFTARGFNSGKKNSVEETSEKTIKNLDSIPLTKEDEEAAEKAASFSKSDVLAEKIRKVIMNNKRRDKI